jgi:hypothetical protein
MLFGFTKNELCLICDCLHGTLSNPSQDRDGGRRFILDQVTEFIRTEKADEKWDVARTTILEKIETLDGWHSQLILGCVKRFWELTGQSKDYDAEELLRKAGFDTPTAYLMNSAVIPSGTSGTYRYTWYAETDGTLARFIKDKHPVSRIGYADACDMVQDMSGGYRPRLSRSAALIEPGDCAMVIRLKYRLADTGPKRVRMKNKEDYEIGLLERLD